MTHGIRYASSSSSSISFLLHIHNTLFIMASRRRLMNSSARPHPQMVPDASIEEIWSRPNWMPLLEKVFIQILTLTMNTPPYASPGKFSDDKRDSASKEFRRDAGLEFANEELKKQLLMLKKRYSRIKPYYSVNGHGWDHRRKMIVIYDSNGLISFRIRLRLSLIAGMVVLYTMIWLACSGKQGQLVRMIDPPLNFQSVTPAPTPRRINKRPSEKPSGSAPHKRIQSEALNNVVTLQFQLQGHQMPFHILLLFACCC